MQQAKERIAQIYEHFAASSDIASSQEWCWALKHIGLILQQYDKQADKNSSQELSDKKDHITGILYTAINNTFSAEEERPSAFLSVRDPTSAPKAFDRLFSNFDGGVVL